MAATEAKTTLDDMNNNYFYKVLINLFNVDINPINMNLAIDDGEVRAGNRPIT